MAKLAYLPKSDILFKLLFTKHQDLLRSFVAAALPVPKDSIKRLTVTNPEILPEIIQAKFCRLDLNMEIDGQIVDVEIQVKDEGNFRERALFYWAKLYTGALKAGGNYREGPRTVLISVIGFNLFEGEEYRSDFEILEKRRGELLTDRLGIHFFELKKLPVKADPSDRMEMWLRFLGAETEEELRAIETIGGEEMAQAVRQVERIAGTAEYRELERAFELARLDEGQALYNAEQRGIETGEQRGEQRGIEIGEQRGIEIGTRQSADAVLELIEQGCSIEDI